MGERRQDAFDVKADAEADAAARIAQARAWAEREVERKTREAREAGLRVLELEAERVREREEHRMANETLQAMQRTRLWRVGSAYWRLRDALLRRG